MERFEVKPFHPWNGSQKGRTPMTENYGVLVDYGAARRPEGVPGYWDGWYSEEEDALAAAEFWQQKHPRARVYLMRGEKVERPASERWRRCTTQFATATLGGPAVTSPIAHCQDVKLYVG
jgi:hypothetical protein